MKITEAKTARDWIAEIGREAEVNQRNYLRWLNARGLLTNADTAALKHLEETARR